MIRPAEELGPVLAGRPVAAMLRERVEVAVGHGESVILDFAGVEAMSPSFADELFAKLSIKPDDERLHFENLREDLQALARYVIEGRPDQQ